MINKNDNLPFFLHHGNANTTYIIDNKILGIHYASVDSDN